MKRIPCLVLGYYDHEYFFRALDCLRRQAQRLEIIVAENRSPCTRTVFEPRLREMVTKGEIEKYVLFAKNICSNAFEVVLDTGLIDLDSSDYALVTDGDLDVVHDTWLDEELQILDQHPEVFACGIGLDASNLPLDVYPHARAWLPNLVDKGSYYEDYCGMHLVLFRSAELKAYLAFRRKHFDKFLDYRIALYAGTILGKKCASTRFAQARHLAWDRIRDVQHPYTKHKLAMSFDNRWEHYRYSRYTVYTQQGAVSRIPVSTICTGWGLEAVRRAHKLYRLVVPEFLRRSARNKLSASALGR